MSSKGQNKEQRISVEFREKTALLVSPLLLRRIGAGQIDYCFIENGILHVLEAKSSLMGAQAYKMSQRARLLKSAAFLSEITEKSSKILLV